MEFYPEELETEDGDVFVLHGSTKCFWGVYARKEEVPQEFRLEPYSVLDDEAWRSDPAYVAIGGRELRALPKLSEEQGLELLAVCGLKEPYPTYSTMEPMARTSRLAIIMQRLLQVQADARSPL